jgi:hypothetical protein
VLRYVKGTARNDVQHKTLVPSEASDSVTAYVPTAHLW